MIAALSSAVLAGAALWWWYVLFPAPGADRLIGQLAEQSPWVHVAIRAWHYLAPGVVLVASWAGAEAVWWWVPPSRGETVGEIAARWATRAVRVVVAFVMASGVHGSALVLGLAVTWARDVPFPAPEADPVVGLLAARAPLLHDAARLWHYLAPGIALVGSWAGAHAVGRVWLPSRGETVGDVARRTLARGWLAWSAFLTRAGVRRPLIIGTVGAIWWRFLPFPAPEADPVVGLLAGRSPLLHDAARLWHYLAPGIALVGSWAVMQGVGRVWFESRRETGVAGRLPAWPLTRGDPGPALVVGEVHHPVALREVEKPSWLVVPEKGLYTGLLICGAVGSGKTSACMRPFAKQLLSWQADDPARRMAGLVLEVKGDFCHQVRDVMVEAKRGGDYVELGLGGRWSWNPLGAHWLDSYSLAYTIASLINQLFGKGHEPFWQQAYTNLVRWVIELHRMRPGGWVTLQDVYRCTIEPQRIATMLEEVEKTAGGDFLYLKGPAMRELREHQGELAQVFTLSESKDRPGEWGAAWSEEREKALGDLKGAWTVDRESGAGRAGRLRIAAVRRWFTHDWSKLDKKVATTIVEGLSVFLSVFDLPEIAEVFCPPDPNARAAVPKADAAAAGGSAREVAVDRRPLPPLDEVIESGTVLALNMPAGTNAALARAVGVMLKQSWLHTLLRRPAAMHADPSRVFRPAMFLCDEYQAFATVGEDDPSGDEKAFALTRQCRLVPIVATQSISSLRAVLGQGEAWRALLQTLRTRVFLSLSDDASAQLASGLCGQVARMKASYTVSEQTQRASASVLTGAAGGGAGSVGASKAFSEKREPLFHPRDFTILGNCQAIVQAYDGQQSHDATRCYLKPDFLPRELGYWRAREAGKL